MLCDLHFEANCFINVAEKRLIRDAVPTIEVLEKVTILLMLVVKLNPIFTLYMEAGDYKKI